MTQHCCTWQHIASGTHLFLKNNTSSLIEQHLYISHQHSQPSHILAQSTFRNQILQETMIFLGETNSQTIVNSRLAFSFSNGSIIDNKSGVYLQSSTLIPIRVPNDCGFLTLKSRMHNTLQLTDNQYLDEVYYRQSFTYASNQFAFNIYNWKMMMMLTQC